MRVTLINYPGSFGLEPMRNALAGICGHTCEVVSDLEDSLGTPDLVVLPGGASYGDYLRPGALAKVSPVSGPLRRFVENGGQVIGVGNGFQILCELGLLPGALQLNRTTEFFGGKVHVRVESRESFCTRNAKRDVLRLPIGCYFGSYYADVRTLRDLKENDRVALRYCDEEGEVDPENEPSGSTEQIAGVINRGGNVIGMMVHPELAVEEIIGGTDGLELLRFG